MEQHLDYTFWKLWCEALDAIYHANYARWKDNGMGDTDWWHGEHYWHIQVRSQFSLHPLVERIIRIDCIRPVNWQLLLLEWPHVSVEDDCMIAYTRNEAAGQDYVDNGSKRQTRTTIGKYLSRHWPHVPDHMRRDWAGRIRPAKYEIWDTMEGIISGVELGPQSCMKSSHGTIPFREYDNEQLCSWQSDKDVRVAWHKHPYIVYNPKYGWRMAVRIDTGRPDIVMGRCLVNANDMTYVRSYARNASEGGTSYSDEKLEAWLQDKGYCKKGGWSGCKVARVDHPDHGLMLPYLDGSPQNASDQGDHLHIRSGGNLDGTNTDGTGGSDEGDAMGDCVRCDETVYENDDDRIPVGRDGEDVACGGCACHFTRVRGNTEGTYSRHGNWAAYYISDDDAVEVDGIDYDPEHLPDEIKTLHDGEYAHGDNCVYVESEDAYYLHEDVIRCESDDAFYVDGSDDIVEIDNKWYRKDDDDVVECRDDEYRLKEDCWEDDETGDWYSNDDEAIVISGNMYHPDTVKQWLIDAGQMNLDLEY